MPKKWLEQIFGIKPRKTGVPEGFSEVEEDEIVDATLPIALQNRGAVIPAQVPVQETLPVPTSEAAVPESDVPEQAEGFGGLLQNPEFAYVLAALGSAIGGKGSVGEALGVVAQEQIQSSIYTEYMEALEEGTDPKDIPGFNILPVSLKIKAKEEQRATQALDIKEEELGIKERAQILSEEDVASLASYRSTAEQKIISDIENRMGDRERLEYNRATQMMLQEANLKSLEKRAGAQNEFAKQLKLLDRIIKATDVRVKDDEGVLFRLTPGETEIARKKYAQEETLKVEGASPEIYKRAFPFLPADESDVVEDEMYMTVKDGKWIIIKAGDPDSDKPYATIKEID